MSHETYRSPLAERYASQAMLELWSLQTRHGLWRRLWLALAVAERDLGIDISKAAIDEMRAHLDDIDFDAVAEYEKRFRHDVMAHMHAFGDRAPAAKGVIHLGATSCFVTDNGDLIQMKRGLELLRGRVVTLIRTLATFARTWKDEPTLGYTHLQAAQLTTVGKRATLWLQDLVLDLAELDHRLATLPMRGVKGTTGTQASFLELLGGDHAKVRKLDQMVCVAMGFGESIPVSGQTYSRKIDAQVMDILAGISASAAKFASDLRMLQSFGEIEEPFGKDQVGSSAMAYKRNPMRSERINSLARFVQSIAGTANQTHGVQYFERTLDDSAIRRITIPEAFLATDAILILMENVASGLEVHPARIRQRIAEELPFMATESLIVRAVQAGGDRQAVHEVIRQHSIAAARAMKDEGKPNDMLERLGKDPAFPVPSDDLRKVTDPRRFTGRAAHQVDEFLAEVIAPILDSAGEAGPAREEVRV
jgi:adenylosuccinate lyase